MRKTVICFIYSLILFIPYIANGQETINGMFSNSNNEFICIEGDTIRLKIFNNGAFLTYFLWKGTFKLNNNKIKLNGSNMLNTSFVRYNTRSDSNIVFYMSYNDSIAMVYVYVKIIDDNNRIVIDTISDINGKLVLTNEQIKKISNSNVTVRIETLGFATKMNFMLLPGYDYIIQSLIPERIPFTLRKKIEKIRIEKVNTEDIIFSYEDIRTELKLTKKHCSCNDSLFYKK